MIEPVAAKSPQRLRTPLNGGGFTFYDHPICIPQLLEHTMSKSARGVRKLDAQIGQRIREARKAQEMAQEVLANGLGITFQQVQKYENGSNRVSATRLYDIANVLGMPISYFYEGAEPFVRSVNRRKARAASRGA